LYACGCLIFEYVIHEALSYNMSKNYDGVFPSFSRNMHLNFVKVLEMVRRLVFFPQIFSTRVEKVLFA
jgi:hypothetical protein